MDKLVNFATRHNAHLDNIYSSIPEYTKLHPQKLPPLVGNEQDHCCIFMPPEAVYERNSKQQLVEALYAVDWQCVYNESDVNGKAEVFQSMVPSIVNNVRPIKRKRVREDDPCL